MDGKFEIEPSEAKTVRKIFSLYLSGQGYEKIAKVLTADGDMTRYGHKDWEFTDVKRILKNYTYTGNLIPQTTYRDNHINKKTLKNNGQLPKFQVIEAHEPIIAVDEFCRVQEEIQRRSESQNRIIEPGNKLFGTPVFQYEPGIRTLCSDTSGDDWEMLTPARPLDITHTVDAKTVDNLLLEIIDDPPVLPPQSQEYPNTPINVNISSEEV